MSEERDELGETGAVAGTNAGAHVAGVVSNPGQQPPGSVEIGPDDDGYLEGDADDEEPVEGAP